MEDMTTIGEVLEFAIARETEAANFYVAMAETATDSSTVKFFEDLVSEEIEHKSRLELEVMKEGIVARTVGVLPDTLTGDPAISPDQVARQMVYTEALSLAILKERRSLKLYVRLSGMVAEEELRETLVSLAEEEARHLIMLEEQYDNAMSERQ